MSDYIPHYKQILLDLPLEDKNKKLIEQVEELHKLQNRLQEAESQVNQLKVFRESVSSTDETKIVKARVLSFLCEGGRWEGPPKIPGCVDPVIEAHINYSRAGGRWGQERGGWSLRLHGNYSNDFVGWGYLKKYFDIQCAVQGATELECWQRFERVIKLAFLNVPAYRAYCIYKGWKIRAAWHNYYTFRGQEFEENPKVKLPDGFAEDCNGWLDRTLAAIEEDALVFAENYKSNKPEPKYYNMRCKNWRRY